jgi:hypothetical protein
MACEVSVFLENKITHLEGITNVLKSENINIRCLTLNNIMHGWGVLNLLVDQPEKAYRVLVEKGNSAFLREVIVLEMKDEAGSLDELLIKLSKIGLHIENAYTRLVSETKTALLILDVPDVIEAGRRLHQYGIKILDDDSVYRR